MKELAIEVRRRRESPEASAFTGQEIVKEAIRAFPREKSEVAMRTPIRPAAQSPLPGYASEAPPEVKLEIEYLLDLAFHKGIGPALAESEKSPYFVQDAFHDALAGKLYPELQKRGIVK